VKSTSEGKRLLSQGAIQVNGEKWREENFTFSPGEHILRVGKKRFLKVKAS